jgi:hypothetical protein
MRPARCRSSARAARFWSIAKLPCWSSRPPGHRCDNAVRRVDPVGHSDRRARRSHFGMPSAPLGGGGLAASVRAAGHMGPGGAGAARRSGARSRRTVRDARPRSDASANDAGLFTDGGTQRPGDGTGAFRPHHRQRRGAPEDGGAVWRLRDGIGATAEGATGNATPCGAGRRPVANPGDRVGELHGHCPQMADLVSDQISTIGLARQGADIARKSAPLPCSPRCASRNCRAAWIPMPKCRT